ncbi:uncharacterized protein LOC129725191 [Wyeomyia smithii]|uniref:uncharacterized protein LOC129725191 n=1 Tax=Wyeomyia smithii TaxID=174621 RepID=UPI0024680A49|nr:uncharacterized protein LOC129725191 [Wyeomyia smithii]
MSHISTTAKADNDSDSNRVDTTTGESSVQSASRLNHRYFRRHLNAAFQNYGSQRPEEIFNAHYIEKHNRSDVEQFVNDLSTKSEEYVYEMMRDKEEFVQVTNWSELMHSAGLKETCNHELALAMKMIAFSERFPDPKNAKDVNFKQLYMNLSNMMLGYPIDEMNAATAKVLKDTYEETLAQLKQSDNSSNINLLRERLSNIAPPRKSSSDCLANETLPAYFADTNLNPLQIPFENLFYVSK